MEFFERQSEREIEIVVVNCVSYPVFDAEDVGDVYSNLDDVDLLCEGQLEL